MRVSDKITFESRKEAIFHEVCDESLQNGGRIIMSHFGKFSTELVGRFTDEIEHIMKSKNTSKSLTKKMFSVMVEGLQNICIHGKGVTKNVIYGHVVVVESDEGYMVSFGNFISNDKKRLLKKQLNKVNRMNSSELKEFYLTTLSKGALTDKNGAGLGIITMALKFKSKINFQFKPCVEDLKYYSLEINTA